MYDVMTETFQHLINETNKLSYGENTKLDEIIKQTKIAINNTFGKQHNYLKQLDNISFIPSIYDLTYQEHFKILALKEIETMPPNEFKEDMRHKIVEFYKINESTMRETSWSSGMKGLSRFLENLLKHAWLYEPDQKLDKLNIKIKKDRLSIQRGDDELVKLRISPTKDDPKGGELDVMIDAPFDMVFDMVDVHQPDKIHKYEKMVCACTWHGCYINQGRMLPKINLKIKRNPDVKLSNEVEGRHCAIVSQAKKIAVPVCRIHIPSNLKIESHSNQSKLAVQLDFFILPKDFPWEKYVETTVYKLYCLFADICAFDPYMRCMLIPASGDNHILDIEICKFELKTGRWDAILRCIYVKDPAMAMSYSISFPATIDPDLALDRLIAEDIQNTPYEEDESTGEKTLRALHEIELRRLGISDIDVADGIIPSKR